MYDEIKIALLGRKEREGVWSDLAASVQFFRI